MLPDKVNDHIDRMTDKEIRMWLRRPKKFKTRKHQEFIRAVRKARRSHEGRVAIEVVRSEISTQNQN
jgi:hypothetical protein